MKSTLIAIGLFGFTALTVALFPVAKTTFATTQIPDPPPVADPQAGSAPRVEVVFVLDTTGSMEGLIAAAKEKIWSIATTLASANQAPEISMGLVAYRDRGDAYVTRVVDLSPDLDTVYATLMDLRADGGGDGPESVNQALHDAVHGISWGQGDAAYRVVFLVGDAPPHMDYPDGPRYPAVLAAARERGIVVNAIQSGSLAATRAPWRHIAQLGAGRYFQVGQGGDAVAIATPFDEEMATLSAELDATRLYYGDAEDRAEGEKKQEAAAKLHRESSVASRARRATFNTSASGERNLLGEGELVDDVASGRVELESIPATALPEPVRALPAEEQAALIDETARRRDALKRQIDTLARQRADFLDKEVGAVGGAPESLDQKVYEAVREQAGSAGLRYEADAPSY